ncbi:MAG: DUF6531 domain-containing protein, partial [Rhodothermales bacterium]
MIAAKWYDMLVGIDIHWVMVPTPAPVPTPLPHPFTGLIFDPIGLAVSTAISGAMALAFGGPFTGPVFINSQPAANTGTEGTNLLVMPHIPTPPGTAWAPVPAGLKPPIPGQTPDPGIPSPVPSNDAILITGSKTVHINGTNACRLGDLAMSCGEPIRLPSSTTIAVPMGMPVLIGGPPALDFMAAIMGMIRTQWVSGRLHALLQAPPGSWRSKIICFFTGHPVDVVSGMVMTDAVDVKLPGPIPFAFERTYYSRSDYDGPLGHGWTHAYDQFLRFEPHRIVLHAGDGRELYFDATQEGETTRNHAERLDLTRRRYAYEVSTNEGLRYVFGPQARSDGTWPLLRIEDRNGNKIQLGYDEQGRLIQIIDSAGRELRFINDREGRLRTLNVPHPNAINERLDILRFDYDADGDLVTVYDALAQPFRYMYKYHLLVQETNRNGLSFYFAYDGIDKDAWCVRTWGDEGIYDHVLIYDKDNRITIVEDSLGHTTTYVANEKGLVDKKVDPLGGETLYEWNESFWKTAETDPGGHTTRYEYDERGNRTREIKPDGTIRQTEYNGHNYPVRFIDENGAAWQWHYDGYGRVAEQTDPLGYKKTLRYERGQLTGMMDGTGAWTTLEYDEQGNITALRTPDGAVARWAYDRLGRVVESVDPRGNVQRRGYDLIGRLIRIEEPDGQIRDLFYDAEDNLVRARDLRHDVIFTYHGMNRMASRTEAGVRVEFFYDTEGRPVGIRNEQGFTYTFELDANGQVRTEISFDQLRREYVRDAAGRVAEVHLPGGRITKYAYDPMGRLIKVEDADGRVVSFGYNAGGDLVEIANDTTVVTFERDILGRIVKEWQGEHWVASTYDQAGRRVSIASSLGARHTYERNAMGDVDLVSLNGGMQTPWEIRFTHDQMRQELERRFPGGVASVWKRDQLGRPVRHEVGSAARSHWSRQYSWSFDNQLVHVLDALRGPTNYQYDTLGNLAWAQRNGTLDVHACDAVGNVFRTRDQSDRTYGPAGQALEASGSRYTYDEEGNLVEKEEPDGKVWRYRWNTGGMLEEVERPDGDTVMFTYDALGRRMSKVSCGRTTRWVWNGGNPLHEWVRDHDAAGHEREIARDPLPSETEEALLTWVFKPESFVPMAKLVGAQRFSIVSNHLGIPEAMFDEGGAQVWGAET